MAGNYEADGLDEDTARTLADTYLGLTGVYDDYASQIRASELGGVDEQSIYGVLDQLQSLYDSSTLSTNGADALYQQLLGAPQMSGLGDAEQLAMQAILAQVLQAAGQMAPTGANSTLGELAFRKLLEQLQSQLAGGGGWQPAGLAGSGHQSLGSAMAAIQAMQALALAQAAAAGAMASQSGAARSFLPRRIAQPELAADELIDRVLRGSNGAHRSGDRRERFDVRRDRDHRSRDRLAHEAAYLKNKVDHEQHATGTAEVAEGLRAASRTPIRIPAARTPPRVVNGPKLLTRAPVGEEVAAAGREVAVIGREGAVVARSSAAAAEGASALSKAGSGLARAAGPIAVVANAYDIGTSLAADNDRGDGKYTETKKAVGRTAGGWVGAFAGAKAGGATLGIAGAAVGGPVGAAIGGAVGVIGGGIAGALGGSQIGEWFMSEDEHPPEGRGGEVTLEDPKATAEEIESHLTRGITDWAVTDNDARKAVSLLSHYDDDDLKRLTEEMDPALLNRMEDQLPDEDKRTYARTLDRISSARNSVRERLSDGEVSSTVSGLTDKLSYGIADWAVTDGNARDVVNELSKYGDRESPTAARRHGPGVCGSAPRERQRRGPEGLLANVGAESTSSVPRERDGGPGSSGSAAASTLRPPRRWSGAPPAGLPCPSPPSRRDRSVRLRSWDQCASDLAPGGPAFRERSVTIWGAHAPAKGGHPIRVDRGWAGSILWRLQPAARPRLRAPARAVVPRTR